MIDILLKPSTIFTTINSRAQVALPLYRALSVGGLNGPGLIILERSMITCGISCSFASNNREWILLYLTSRNESFLATLDRRRTGHAHFPTVPSSAVRITKPSAGKILAQSARRCSSASPSQGSEGSWAHASTDVNSTHPESMIHHCTVIALLEDRDPRLDLAQPFLHIHLNECDHFHPVVFWVGLPLWAAGRRWRTSNVTAASTT